MANDVNSVTLIGRLTRDPEFRTTNSGTSVCDLGLAVNESVKRGEEWQEDVSFFDITVWGRQAESVATHMAKGRQVGIAGRLKQERWENDQGEKRSKVKVVANTVQFLGGKGEGEGGSAPSAATKQDDDLPF